jgi:type II restriction enzyme
MFEQVVISPASEVREKFKRVKPLKDISVTQRGWTLDVLNAIRRLGKTEFTTTDAYAFTRELEKLHPDNRHVRDKIRQQLQVLRDMGLLIHLGRGEWKLP